MRARFRDVPFDLIVVVVVALSILPLTIAGVGGPIRYLLALALVFLLPGYTLAAILFPTDGDMDWIRRLALAVGLSIASVALLGLLLDATPWGLNVYSIVGSLLLFTLTASGVAWWRRLSVPKERRLALSIEVSFPRWRGFRLADRLLAVGVVLALMSGLAVVALGLANPPGPNRYTEFYLLDSRGGLLDYPLSLNTTDQGVVIVGIHNAEGAPVNYTVVVLLVSLKMVYNATTGTNDTVEGNTTFLDSFAVPVASGATSEKPYPISIPLTGQYLLEFRLFMGVPQGEPYRFVDLRISVS